MNTEQINEALKFNQRFDGVFPADMIPERLPIGHAVIVNTDVASEPGQHWVALFATADREGEYFDSFGRPPFVRAVTTWCDTHFFRGYIHSSVVLQHPLSTSCGKFCIEFVKHRTRGVSFEDFILDFSSRLHENEELVQKGCNTHL